LFPTWAIVIVQLTNVLVLGKCSSTSAAWLAPVTFYAGERPVFIAANLGVGGLLILGGFCRARETSAAAGDALDIPEHAALGVLFPARPMPPFAVGWGRHPLTYYLDVTRGILLRGVLA
jgi:hypothetical protein